MKWFKTLALAALVASGAAVQAGPDDDYINLYQLIEDGDQLMASGQNNAARDRFAHAQAALQKIKSSYPEWNPKTVEFRLQYVNERLTKLGGAPATTAPTTQARPAVVAPAADPVTDLRNQIAQLVEERKVLQAKLAEALGAQPAAVDPKELQKAQEQVNALQKEKDLLRVALEQEQAKTAKAADKSGLEAAQKEIAALKSQLAASAAPVTAMDRELAAARESARTNALAVTALQTALAQMKGERDAVLASAAAQSNAKGNDSEQVKALQKERDDLAKRLSDAERDAAKAKLDAPKLVASAKPADDSEQVKALKNERDNLLRRLSSTERELEKAKSKKAKNGSGVADRTDKELEILRSRLTVLEARQIPYTPEEIALLKGTSMSPRTPASKSDAKRKELPPGAGVLLAEAEHAYVAHRLDEAEDKYKQVLKMDPENVITLGNLGMVQAEQRHFPDADATLTKALSLDATDPFILTTLGIVRFQQGKTDEAFDFLSRAVDIGTRDPKTYDSLGQVLAVKGQRGAAETAFRKSIELAPNYAAGHHNLAAFYALQDPQFLELARFHYNKSLSLGAAPDEKIEKIINKK